MKTTRLRLDFASGARHVSPLGLAMLVVSTILFGVAAFQLGEMLAGNARQADTLASLEARRGMVAAGATRPAAPEPAVLARVRAVRQVAQTLTTPWADLLESLESAPNQSVALLAVEPSVVKHSIRLTAEARNAADMLEYLGALQRDARLSSAVLVAHEVQARSPGSPLRFQIQAVWGVGR
jgi:Tfp pilus assembly protein PilN